MPRVILCSTTFLPSTGNLGTHNHLTLMTLANAVTLSALALGEYAIVRKLSYDILIGEASFVASGTSPLLSLNSSNITVLLLSDNLRAVVVEPVALDLV